MYALYLALFVACATALPLGPPPKVEQELEGFFGKLKEVFPPIGDYIKKGQDYLAKNPEAAKEFEEGLEEYGTEIEEGLKEAEKYLDEHKPEILKFVNEHGEEIKAELDKLKPEDIQDGLGKLAFELQEGEEGSHEPLDLDDAEDFVEDFLEGSEPCPEEEARELSKDQFEALVVKYVPDAPKFISGILSYLPEAKKYIDLAEGYLKDKTGVEEYLQKYGTFIEQQVEKAEAYVSQAGSQFYNDVQQHKSEILSQLALITGSDIDKALNEIAAGKLPCAREGEEEPEEEEVEEIAEEAEKLLGSEGQELEDYLKEHSKEIEEYLKEHSKEIEEFFKEHSGEIEQELEEVEHVLEKKLPAKELDELKEEVKKLLPAARELVTPPPEELPELLDFLPEDGTEGFYPEDGTDFVEREAHGTDFGTHLEGTHLFGTDFYGTHHEREDEEELEHEAETAFEYFFGSDSNELEELAEAAMEYIPEEYLSGLEEYAETIFEYFQKHSGEIEQYVDQLVQEYGTDFSEEDLFGSDIGTHLEQLAEHIFGTEFHGTDFHPF